MEWLRRTVGILKANPSGTLLVVQLLGILLYAFVDETPANSLGRLALSLFGMLVVVLALGVVRATPTYTWLGVLIGVPAVVLAIVDWAAAGSQPWHLISNLVHVAFYGYTLIGLLRYMFADEEVSQDEIWAMGPRSPSRSGCGPTRTPRSRASPPDLSRRRSIPRPSAPGWSCSSSPPPP